MTRNSKMIVGVVAMIVVAVGLFYFITKQEEVTIVSAPVDSLVIDTVKVTVDSVKVIPIPADTVAVVDTTKVK